MVLFSLPLLILSSALVSADLPPYDNDAAFEDAAYGPYPVQTFQSSPELAPRPNVLRRHPNPDRSLYTFYEPRGWKVDRPGPMIVDSDWNLVWTSTKWGNAYNFQVQNFKGKDYLTFWAGDDGIGGHGEGYMYMLNSRYQTVKTFNAKNGMMADQHGFHFTEKGTIIYTIYETTRANLDSVSDFGDGYIWDCLFQEVDFETNTLLFEWRATDHIPFTDIYGPPHTATYWQPWDWFHINSVDKDAKGNYLISSRYAQALYYVHGSTGEVLWTLGGKHSNFTDLSDGHASDFCYQHDARWRDDFTRISLFDNHADNAHPTLGDSRGLMLNIDTTQMTVSIATEYYSPRRMSCLSQGSMQVLDSGNVFIGWGYCAAYTEFDANGTALSDVHTGPQSEYILGNTQSYRAKKFRWKGYPVTNPSIAVNGSSVYVSWNGATEVKTWELQESNNGWWTREVHWKTLLVKEKQGFETRFDFDPQTAKKYLRVVGYDTRGGRLGRTKKVDRWFAQTYIARRCNLPDVPSFFIFISSIGICGYVLVRFLKHWVRRAVIANYPQPSKLRAWRMRKRSSVGAAYAAFPAFPAYGDEGDGYCGSGTNGCVLPVKES